MGNSFQWKYKNKARDGSCYDCGLDYKSYTDIYLSPEVWKRISPDYHNRGYLCPNCIMSRLSKLEIKEVKIKVDNPKK